MGGVPKRSQFQIGQVVWVGEPARPTGHPYTKVRYGANTRTKHLLPLIWARYCDNRNVKWAYSNSRLSMRTCLVLVILCIGHTLEYYCREKSKLPPPSSLKQAAEGLNGITTAAPNPTVNSLIQRKNWKKKALENPILQSGTSYAAANLGTAASAASIAVAEKPIAAGSDHLAAAGNVIQATKPTGYVQGNAVTETAGQNCGVGKISAAAGNVSAASPAVSFAVVEQPVAASSDQIAAADNMIQATKLTGYVQGNAEPELAGQNCGAGNCFAAGSSAAAPASAETAIQRATMGANDQGNVVYYLNQEAGTSTTAGKLLADIMSPPNAAAAALIQAPKQAAKWRRIYRQLERISKGNMPSIPEVLASSASKSTQQRRTSPTLVQSNLSGKDKRKGT
ncbi:LOW QUALITY PROTEIN: hypothetical protein M9H77_25181 [Catharanthus roseus]|uniref:Uncharacterized protein n=1 Tax=Catharanthus roseus TaxID=4058 RepID=A0ACC0A8Q7_CATRO|nr:LOW QUALITY PROTEIN: hypothetical protein M9H77_25181 [Catharanthus roseus]